MSSGIICPLDGRLYRAALSLCPAGFRREHGDEMARDFDEARGEAAAEGDRALWILRLLMAVDLARTLVIQWLRTRLPAIALASISVTLALAEGLATVALRARIQVPAREADAEILGLMLLAVMSVMLIAMTIVITQWVNRPRRRRRR
jgi:hypothetical protein